MVDEATASDDTIWPEGFDPEAVGVIFGYVVLVGRVQAACRPAVWGASIWGTEGPEFKSRQPDNRNRRPGRISGCRDSGSWGSCHAPCHVSGGGRSEDQVPDGLICAREHHFTSR